MAMNDKKRKTDMDWQRKNYKMLSTKLYREDAEDFEKWCAENKTSVNAKLKELISQTLGRPLTNRTKERMEGAEE